MIKAGVLKDLQNAAKMQYPVEISRGGEGWAEWIYGFVIRVGQRWVVLQMLADAVYPDGYALLPLADISAVADDREGGFIERSVVGLGGRPKADFKLPVDGDTREVLQAVAAHAKLFSVNLEAEDDSPRLIGHLDRLNARTFRLQLINPRGVWTAQPSTWWYKDVTSLSFGSRYEAALERFGEEPPVRRGASNSS